MQFAFCQIKFVEIFYINTSLARIFIEWWGGAGQKSEDMSLDMSNNSFLFSSESSDMNLTSALIACRITLTYQGIFNTTANVCFGTCFLPLETLVISFISCLALLHDMSLDMSSNSL